MTVGEYHEAMKAEGSEPDVSEFDGGYYKSLRRAITIYQSPTECPLRGYGRAGTQNDRLAQVLILSTGTPMSAQWACRR